MSWEGYDLRLVKGSSELLCVPSVMFSPGRLTVVLGANGAGKTSLLRALLHLDPEAKGRSSIDGQDLRDLGPAERARRVSYLPQKRSLAWPMTVRGVVSLGRFAYGGSPDRLSPHDAAKVDQALARCELADLAGRRADTLSGGEEARLHIARGLAAATPWLIADEPTASLDAAHQHSVLRLLKEEAERGAGIILVLHDLALAARYAEDVVLMKAGNIVASGPKLAVLTETLLTDVYGVRIRTDGTNVSVEP